MVYIYTHRHVCVCVYIHIYIWEYWLIRSSHFHQTICCISKHVPNAEQLPHTLELQQPRALLVGNMFNFTRKAAQNNRAWDNCFVFVYLEILEVSFQFWVVFWFVGLFVLVFKQTQLRGPQLPCWAATFWKKPHSAKAPRAFRVKQTPCLLGCTGDQCTEFSRS